MLEKWIFKAKIEDISKKRAAYIAAKLKDTPKKKDPFDIVVYKFIKTQAAKKNILY